MFKKSFIRAFFLLAVLTAGILVVAATKAHKNTEEDVCTEANDQCEKTKAQGEFIILEALNRAVMATAR
ncbi:hypothetical protein [Paraflavitalea sp. CAU 1676]|uniref:hypothetical protein n=1 Tax=Paraflavitalea sp. CAU 1676 TaxID=3032598 RepID=UPI0023D97AD2|nr:hypothetical protein [Paraflavitalea sp. CAU 1676]MDF2186979.1 hypothetical protein [Paraflavitalea sp. CAU 1676]